MELCTVASQQRRGKGHKLKHVSLRRQMSSTITCDPCIPLRSHNKKHCNVWSDWGACWLTIRWELARVSMSWSHTFAMDGSEACSSDLITTFISMRSQLWQQKTNGSYASFYNYFMYVFFISLILTLPDCESSNVQCQKCSSLVASRARHLVRSCSWQEVVVSCKMVLSLGNNYTCLRDQRCSRVKSRMSYVMQSIIWSAAGHLVCFKAICCHFWRICHQSSPDLAHRIIMISCLVYDHFNRLIKNENVLWGTVNHRDSFEQHRSSFSL